jgi:hypothetical protein
MAERKMNPEGPSDERWLDAKIAHALETAPAVEIPAGFAARIAAQVPPLETVALTPRHYGRNAAIVSVGVLLALIAVFAHRSMGSSLLWTSIEGVFCLQLALVAFWLTAGQGREDSGWKS